MQAGKRAFAHRVDAGNVRAAGEVRDHTAAGVVCRGNHGQRVAAHVEAEFQAALIDAGKVFLDEGLVVMRDIQPDMRLAGAFHFRVDRAGDDVTRREFGAGIVARHEAAAVGQAQNRTFAAQRFADQKRPCLRMEQAGRVKLHELHVRDPRAGPPGHRDAVAARGMRIAAVEIDQIRAAGREHHAVGGEGADDVGLDIQHIHAPTTSARLVVVGHHDQLDRHVVFEHRDLGRLAGQAFQRGFHCTASGVLGVNDAAMAVAAFTVQVIRIAGIPLIAVGAGKGHAAIDQPLDRLARVRHGMTHRGFVAQAGTGGQGIGHMGFHAVVGIEHGRDAALGVERAAFGKRALGNDRDSLSAVRQAQGQGKTGRAAANDDDIEPRVRL